MPLGNNMQKLVLNSGDDFYEKPEGGLVYYDRLD